MKISFTDFWDKFDPHNNFFLDLLNEITGEQPEVVVHPSTADVLIYSCFGEPQFGGRGGQHKSFDKNKIIKIFYTGENIRPNFDDCTYSFTFDFEDHGGKNVRIPLWMLQLDWYEKGGYGNPQYVVPLEDIRDNDFIRKPKTEFCALMCSSLRDNRVECFEKLGVHGTCHGYGKPFGNWTYGEDVKMDTLSHYRFSICFENTKYPGYYTEKLLHAKLSGNIPIYWADERISEDFNPESFINLNNFKSMDDLVDHVVQVNSDPEMYKEIASHPLWDDSRNPANKKQKVKEEVKNLLKL